MKKKIKEIVIIAIVIYLIISALYVFFHIDFSGSLEGKIVGMGFSEPNNMLRLFMGLPKTFTTNENVSPLFLIEVVIKIIIAIGLIMYLRKIMKKESNKSSL